MMGSQEESVDVAQMALYNLNRARKTMEGLSHKNEWQIEDTAEFDCMHYLGNAAIDNAARELGLEGGDTVVDIGAGFSATGRYLYRNYGVKVIGVELQKDIHDLAETIIEKNKVAPSVRSLNVNFLDLDLPAPVDHIVSFLCILHIPERNKLFGKAARVLKTDGKMYIEDFYAREELSGDAKQLLRDVISCPYLPSREQYIDDLRTAGLETVRFQDMSTEWAEYVHQRAVSYGRQAQQERLLAVFYNTVDQLFATGGLGGCRITCVNTKQ